MRLLMLIAFTACLLLAPAAHAAPMDCGGLVSLDVPADWMILEEATTDAEGLMTAILANKARSASVSLVGGPSMGLSAREMADKLAPNAGAVKEPVEFQGQFGFPIHSKRNDVSGFCILSTDKDKFLLTCINGELGLASALMDSMKSAQYPGLPVK